MDLLTNPVRVYDWGSTTAIPELLGLPPDGRSQAELWIGAHERAPSSVVRGDRRIGLDEVIAADPLGEVGSVGTGSPRLPFMAKVLAVDEPLSLQVHPGAEQAAWATPGRNGQDWPCTPAYGAIPTRWPSPS